VERLGRLAADVGPRASTPWLRPWTRSSGLALTRDFGFLDSGVQTGGAGLQACIPLPPGAGL